MRRILFAACAALLLQPAVAVAAEHGAIEHAAADPGRSEKNRARDQYRHPVETLTFFGVKPTDTIVEIYPSGGWYAEILAPLVRDKGVYYAATQPPGKYRDATVKLFESDPARFGKAKLTILDPSKPSEIAPPGTADAVLTFRSVHNLLMAGDAAAAQAFADFYKALKPGGVLGVVDHRLPETADTAREKSSGYIKQSTVVRLATAAGFKLAAESDVNANPKDTADWPDGVWTLPPSLRNGDKDRERYLAIGESDRMTLKFVKPE
ncbi:MAG: class I SAM-dependent methyltransferase [Sphingomonadaceae bacterium]